MNPNDCHHARHGVSAHSLKATMQRCVRSLRRSWALGWLTQNDRLGELTSAPHPEADIKQRAWGVRLLPQDKIAVYLFNGPEYMESAFAAFKAWLVPVNTNYRYVDGELHYLD